MRSSSMVHVVSEGSEKSVVIAGADRLQSERDPTDGRVQVLMSGSKVPGEVVGSGCMSANAFCEFFESEIIECKAQDTLSKLHLKATTMKVSDPIVFDHYTQKLFKDVFQKHAAIFEDNQVKAMLGLGDALENIKQFPEQKRPNIDADSGPCSATRPPPAMADSHRGITISRAPSDVSIDAAIPAMISGMGGWGGGTWSVHWLPQDQDSNVCCTSAKSADPCQPGVFVDEVELCKKKGACNPATMGFVPNDVVMPQRAPEHGSHDRFSKRQVLEGPHWQHH